MPSRFGLRQLVILLLVLGCAGALVLAMVQNNRRVVSPSASQSATTTDRPLITKTYTDESWARPGVPIAEIAPRLMGWQATSHDDQSELVEALESEPQTLTPFFATDAQARRVIQGTVCETLATIDPETQTLRAELGYAWQEDPAGLWLRVRLDDSARFSDGTPVTAEDVKFSLDVLRMPGLDAERTRGALEGIGFVEVISPFVAEFHFKEARPLNVLHALCSLYIVPKHFYEQFTPEQLNRSTGLLMGSGPFALKSMDPDNQWKPGSDIVLVPHRLDVPYLDSLRFTVITDAAARLTALRNGDIHIMRGSADQIALLKTDSDFTAQDRIIADPGVGSSFSAIAWNCADTSILADHRVRLAMTSLLDRQRIVDEFYAGAAAIATSPFPFRSPMNDSAITPWPFDPARAAALLDEAGWTSHDAEGVRTNTEGNTLDIDLAIPQGSKLAEFVALMLKDEAAKAGVRFNIITADIAAIGDMQRSGEYDGAIVSWTHGLPENEPRQQWHSASITDGDNTTRFASPEADRLIEQGEREMDTAKRMALWHELHAVLHDEQPFTFLVNPPWIRFMSKRVVLERMTPNGFDYEAMEFRPDAAGDPR